MTHEIQDAVKERKGRAGAETVVIADSLPVTALGKSTRSRSVPY